MQSRNKPLHILGLLAGAIVLMVVVTVLISTVTFMRNKHNRILPNRRVRRRRPQTTTTTPTWLNRPFKRQDTDKFKVSEEEEPEERESENVNYNNNVSNVSNAVRIWPPPPPPCAPTPPPPPVGGYRDRQWTVPTVSAAVVPKPRKKPAMNRQDTVNKALVSELKLRLEQKRLNHQ